MNCSEDAQMLEYWNTQPKVQLKCQVMSNSLQVYQIHHPVRNILVVANTLMLYFVPSGKGKGGGRGVSITPNDPLGDILFLVSEIVYSA